MPPSPFPCSADVSLDAHLTLSKPECATFCRFLSVAAHSAYLYKYLAASGCTREEKGHSGCCVLVPMVNFLPKSHVGLSVTT